MVGYGKWIAVVGGVVAAVGEFVPGYYLAVIGGVIAIIGGIMSK